MAARTRIFILLLPHAQPSPAMGVDSAHAPRETTACVHPLLRTPTSRSQRPGQIAAVPRPCAMTLHRYPLKAKYAKFPEQRKICRLTRIWESQSAQMKFSAGYRREDVKPAKLRDL